MGKVRHWSASVGDALPFVAVCTLEVGIARVLPRLLLAACAILNVGSDLTIPDSLSISTDDAAAQAGPGCVDIDNDGICASLDCDDNNAQKGGPETCDGLDNDCDDLIDEGFNVGSVCSGLTAGGCTRDGLRTCSGGIAVCVLGEGPPEACNGIDDDCDDVDDEGNPGGGGPCNGGGVGACAGGSFQCVSGALGCVAAATPGASEEICNNIDDDCDGVVDEAKGGTGGPLGVPMTESCYFGPAGTSGKGICQAGSWTCLQGQWTTCQGEVRPRGRQCNGLDNDCNDVLDDDEALTSTECENQCTYSSSSELNEVDPDCYGGPIGTRDVGLCAGGERLCELGNLWGACADVRPVAETCNDLDDDCDGEVDEAFEDLGTACSAGVGVCQVNGLWVCTGDHLTIACSATADPPGVEACDGLDNDCDGQIDEVPGVGSECSRGTGACERPGVMACDPVAEDFVCNAPIVVGVDEICNGIDDDCDGTVDDGFLPLGTACTVGVGACSRTGTYICSPVNGTRICDVQPGGPSAEVCDSLDNDCDGLVDEGFGVGNACDGTGECGLGVVECNIVGGARCSTSQGGSQHEPVAESCNGLDDDCDGEADENFYSLGDACYGCGSAPGVWECKADGTNSVCSTGPDGSAIPPEICGDSLDNDCDYSADEEDCVEL